MYIHTYILSMYEGIMFIYSYASTQYKQHLYINIYTYIYILCKLIYACRYYSPHYKLRSCSSIFATAMRMCIDILVFPLLTGVESEKMCT